MTRLRPVRSTTQELITTCAEGSSAARPVLLVTGATGFVGGAVATRALREGDWRVRAAVRRPDARLPEHVDAARVGDLAGSTDWTSALSGVQVVIHAAARVRSMRDHSADPLTDFRNANVAGTEALATQAAAAGVKRFVFVSSIKVNGERTFPGRPFTADDPPAPTEPYGVSKMEAEERLREIGERTGMEIVIVRPVLVYGPGVQGSFRALLRVIEVGVPLPLGAAHNRRSLVSVDNLADLLVVSARHQNAAGETMLVSDGRDFSTTTLLRTIASAMGRPARLVSFPAPPLWALARVTGKVAVVQRLLGSLEVDIARTRDRLHWEPPESAERAVERTVHHFLASQ